MELTNDCFAKCILVFFHSAFGSVLGFHNISFLSDPISESKDQFRITASEMKLAVSAWATISQVLLNDHKGMSSANCLNPNWFDTYFLCIYITIWAIPTMSILTMKLSKNNKERCVHTLIQTKKIVSMCGGAKRSCTRHHILHEPNQLDSLSSSNNFYPQEERGFSKRLEPAPAE